MSTQSQPAAPAIVNAFAPRVAHALLRGLREVLGPEELEALSPNLPVPDQANGNDEGVVSLDTWEQLSRALEERYGPRASWGIAQRIGEAAYKYGFQDLGGEIGLTGTTFRLLSAKEKVQRGLRTLAETFERHLNHAVQVTVNGEELRVEIEDCPFQHEGDDSPGCYLAVGAIQAALYWFSGGRDFILQKEACAPGDTACRISIRPLSK
jgi:predicted hydrocarbon binding protein